jgi:hypothetical protein
MKTTMKNRDRNYSDRLMCLFLRIESAMRYTYDFQVMRKDALICRRNAVLDRLDEIEPAR